MLTLLIHLARPFVTRDWVPADVAEQAGDGQLFFYERLVEVLSRRSLVVTITPSHSYRSSCGDPPNCCNIGGSGLFSSPRDGRFTSCVLRSTRERAVWLTRCCHLAVQRQSYRQL